MASTARIEELRKKYEENQRRYFAPLANEYRKAGQLEEAIALCRAWLPQQPGHMSGHIVFGQTLFEAGELTEARSTPIRATMRSRRCSVSSIRCRLRRRRQSQRRLRPKPRAGVKSSPKCTLRCSMRRSR